MFPLNVRKDKCRAEFNAIIHYNFLLLLGCNSQVFIFFQNIYQ